MITVVFRLSEVVVLSEADTAPFYQAQGECGLASAGHKAI